MNIQTSLFETPAPALNKGDVMRSALIERHEWKEYHPNGEIWITGEIGVIADTYKHLYDYRTGFKGYEGTPVCRLGKWTKYFDNGQLAWTLDYGDGTHDYKGGKFPAYRKDGTPIVP